MFKLISWINFNLDNKTISVSLHLTFLIIVYLFFSIKNISFIYKHLFYLNSIKKELVENNKTNEEIIKLFKEKFKKNKL